MLRGDDDLRIEHVALWVEDIEKMRSFYETYFNGKANQKYYNPTKQFESYFLTFESGARLEIMRKPDLHRQQIRLRLGGLT